jgi:hypothetical protein
MKQGKTLPLEPIIETIRLFSTTGEEDEIQEEGAFFELVFRKNEILSASVSMVIG